MIEYLQALAQTMTMAERIEEVLDKTGYQDFILKHIEKYTMEYILDLIEFAKIYDESKGHEKTLNGFSEEAAFMTDADENLDIDAVGLLSGHRCKGLKKCNFGKNIFKVGVLFVSCFGIICLQIGKGSIGDHLCCFLFIKKPADCLGSAQALAE